jgi:hypothetical protein
MAIGWPRALPLVSVAARSFQPGRARASAIPQLSQVLSFVGEGKLVAVFTVAGRIVLRLRLSPVSRSEQQVILLDLNRGHRNCQKNRSEPSRTGKGFVAIRYSRLQALEVPSLAVHFDPGSRLYISTREASALASATFGAADWCGHRGARWA